MTPQTKAREKVTLCCELACTGELGAEDKYGGAEAPLCPEYYIHRCTVALLLQDLISAFRVLRVG